VENKVDELAKGPQPKHELMRRLIPHAFHGYTKKGHPIYWEKTGSIDIKGLLVLLKPKEFVRAHIWEMERNIQRYNVTRRQQQQIGLMCVCVHVH